MQTRMSKHTPTPRKQLLISWISTKLPDRPGQQAATAFFVCVRLIFSRTHTFVIFSLYIQTWLYFHGCHLHRSCKKLKLILARSEIPKLFLESCEPLLAPLNSSAKRRQNYTYLREQKKWKWGEAVCTTIMMYWSPAPGFSPAELMISILATALLEALINLKPLKSNQKELLAQNPRIQTWPL